ncbi:stage II sporulation P [Gottschalkia acidurici 9a]|uniref:Stage II sporulation P n=1 Tax=Gottschalkia acidurici (strain ATCC 7906 / DSM 604 / BCRC 14475 / CIP 104303 / KCTC 5404 / NCIMB 10678 / 9a) TaxID=1128398 RepID=K0B2K4_GOTA9|nr:stage II sporulation protein P [Gottschalkia acidurici]AFS78841.1 stage II sporulation P [Gottschalkia acidurici 9a]
MVRYIKNKKGSFYIIVAILCIANLILGFEVIKKFSQRKATVPVFNENVEKKESGQRPRDINEVNIKGENFFLDVLASSNSYMGTTLKENYKEKNLKSSVGNIISKPLEFFSPKTYFKMQLPAIFTLVNSEHVNVASNMYNGNPEESLHYEDIIFTEDPSENYNGKQVETTKDLISSEKPNAIKIDDKNPYVLIYHTHATESYAPISKNNYHTEERQYNVISIGEIIGSELQKKGHKVKHVDKPHDLPDYNKSYVNSLATIKDELNKNKSLKFVLDIHRDGYDEKSPSINQLKKAARIDVNGKSAATFSFVVGPDNPNKDELLKFTRYLRDKANEKYPGICKGVLVKPVGKYNQYLSDYSALVEVGSNLNTIDEAKETGKILAEVLDEVINDLKEDK